MRRRGALALTAASLLWQGRAVHAQADDRAEERARMVEVIRAHALDAEPALGRTWIEPRVLDAMLRVPRHDFVPEAGRAAAYADRPLPIGYSQTISQPFIVALMTDMLALSAEHVVLEIGTGSGYQAAVLGQLVRQVHTIEIIPGLAEVAAGALRGQGYGNIATHVGDGYYGLEAAAPFDAVMVTAAAGHIPPPLVRQLKPGGRMVIPVGSLFAPQYLMLVEKDEAGQVRTRQTLPVAFVPLTGGH